MGPQSIMVDFCPISPIGWNVQRPNGQSLEVCFHSLKYCRIGCWWLSSLKHSPLLLRCCFPPSYFFFLVFWLPLFSVLDGFFCFCFFLKELYICSSVSCSGICCTSCQEGAIFSFLFFFHKTDLNFWELKDLGESQAESSHRPKHNRATILIFVGLSPMSVSTCSQTTEDRTL